MHGIAGAGAGAGPNTGALRTCTPLSPTTLDTPHLTSPQALLRSELERRQNVLGRSGDAPGGADRSPLTGAHTSFRSAGGGLAGLGGGGGGGACTSVDGAYVGYAHSNSSVSTRSSLNDEALCGLRHDAVEPEELMPAAPGEEEDGEDAAVPAVVAATAAAAAVAAAAGAGTEMVQAEDLGDGGPHSGSWGLLGAGEPHPPLPQLQLQVPSPSPLGDGGDSSAALSAVSPWVATLRGGGLYSSTVATSSAAAAAAAAVPAGASSTTGDAGASGGGGGGYGTGAVSVASNVGGRARGHHYWSSEFIQDLEDRPSRACQQPPSIQKGTEDDWGLVNYGGAAREAPFRGSYERWRDAAGQAQEAAAGNGGGGVRAWATPGGDSDSDNDSGRGGDGGGRSAAAADRAGDDGNGAVIAGCPLLLRAAASAPPDFEFPGPFKASVKRASALGGGSGGASLSPSGGSSSAVVTAAAAGGDGDGGGGELSLAVSRMTSARGGVRASQSWQMLSTVMEGRAVSDDEGEEEWAGRRGRRGRAGGDGSDGGAYGTGGSGGGSSSDATPRIGGAAAARSAAAGAAAAATALGVSGRGLGDLGRAAEGWEAAAAAAGSPNGVDEGEAAAEAGLVLRQGGGDIAAAAAYITTTSPRLAGLLLGEAAAGASATSGAEATGAAAGGVESGITVGESGAAESAVQLLSPIRLEAEAKELEMEMEQQRQQQDINAASHPSRAGETGTRGDADGGSSAGSSGGAGGVLSGGVRHLTRLLNGLGARARTEAVIRRPSFAADDVARTWFSRPAAGRVAGGAAWGVAGSDGGGSGPVAGRGGGPNGPGSADAAAAGGGGALAASAMGRAGNSGGAGGRVEQQEQQQQQQQEPPNPGGRSMSCGSGGGGTSVRSVGGTSLYGGSTITAASSRTGWSGSAGGVGPPWVASTREWVTVCRRLKACAGCGGYVGLLGGS